MKIKWNIIDWLIVLVILAVIGAGMMFLKGDGTVGVGPEVDKKISVQVELTGKEEAFTKLPQVGDAVTIGVKEKMKVTVTNVEVTPAVMLTSNTEEGTIGETQVPDHYDVKITMEGEGSEGESAIKINGIDIRVGDQAVLKSKKWAGTGYVLAVDVL